MLSFLASEEDAAEAQRRADELGIDRSELLRDALRRRLAALAAEADAAIWEAEPLDDGERALAAVAE